MVKRTIIIFSVIFCLTRPVASDYSNSVKTQRNNSIRANLPDISGVLRNGDVRTASLSAAQHSRSIRFYYAHSIESGCIVKTQQERKNAKIETGAEALYKQAEETKAFARSFFGETPQLIDFEMEQVVQQITQLLRKVPKRFSIFLLNELNDYCQQDQTPGDYVERSEDKRRKGLLKLISNLLTRVPTNLLDKMYDVLMDNQNHIVQTGA